MSQINDGGSAFPQPLAFNPNVEAVTPGMYFPDISGMSLRDWFAGQALAGLMVNYNEHPHTVATCAEIAYDAADAMLAARLTEPE